MLLRPLAVIMLGGTTVFLLRDLFLNPAGVGVVRIGTIAFVAVATILLFAAGDLSLGRLRALEIVLFVSVSVHILVLDHGLLLQEAAAGDAGLVLSRWNLTALSFVLLMATYAIFVPNTWARAAAVIVPLGAAPIALGVLVRARHPEVELLTRSVLTASKITDVVFLLSIAVIVSILGVILIDRFRSVAIDARSANVYDLQERIGQGGMGEVWLAQHQTLARPAAIKIIRPDLLGGGAKDSTRMVTRRFEREARATAGLRSPNTVEIYDFGVTNQGVFYYVMEYLEGLNLETLVKRFGPLPPARAIYLLRQACASLAEAHTRGLVHRDIKPANIHACRLGGEHDFVKVLDFGLVKEQGTHGDTQLTVDGLTTGTPAYMPPELAMQAELIGPATDVYALGCVAYWLVTGKLVFDQPTPMAMVVDHVKTQPAAPSTRTELLIPASLDAAILKCLEKNPADRFATMRELSAALSDVPLEGTRWGPSEAEDWWSLHQPVALGELPKAS